MRKIIIIVVVLAIILGVLFWKFGYLLTSKPASQALTLKMWGLWEEQALIKPAVEAYKKMSPSITIEYTHSNSPNYRTRIQTQISTPDGPDIFMIHSSWLSMFLKNNNLANLPETILSLNDFKSTFYPVAEGTLTLNNKIYALPVEVDGIALYYNEDLLKEANVAIPTNWDEFKDAANKLTKKDALGNIIQAGAAMGSTGNVDHWSDIIAMLFLQQPKADIENPASLEGAEVIRFYTEFITNPQKKVWSQTLESSTQAFYTGKLGFYFAPSWRAHDLREANQNLKFKTAPVPQLPKNDPLDFSSYGSFWAFAVSSKSLHQKESWEFLKFLTSKETEKLLYNEASKVRLFGQPYSRVDLKEEVTADPIVGAFVNQGPIYRGWYLSSNTFDSGINDDMIKYFENAINATLQGVDPLEALKTTQQGVKQTLDKYTGPPAPAQGQ